MEKKSPDSQKPGNGQRRRMKLVIDPHDSVRSVKRILDEILLQAGSLPPAILKDIASARDAAWQIVKAEEEAVIKKTSYRPESATKEEEQQ